MAERKLLFYRIRRNLGTAKRPTFDYFDRWDEGFAWWATPPRRGFWWPVEAKEAAIATLRELRKDPFSCANPRLVRVMGFR